MKKSLVVLLLIVLTLNTYAQINSFDTTLVIQKHIYSIVNEDVNDDCFTMTIFCESKRISIDTIERSDYINIEFPDFNNDNNPDIMITSCSFNIGISSSSLSLFDPISKKFRSVEEFSYYAEANQLKNQPNVYYSYRKAGCADMNWVSYLFKIEDFKIVQMGFISGEGCDFDIEEYPPIIYIYKVIDNNDYKRKLLEKLPYFKFIPNFEDKWTFIEKYWNGNYKKFKNKL